MAWNLLRRILSFRRRSLNVRTSLWTLLKYHRCPECPYSSTISWKRLAATHIGCVRYIFTISCFESYGLLILYRILYSNMLLQYYRYWWMESVNGKKNMWYNGEALFLRNNLQAFYSFVYSYFHTLIYILIEKNIPLVVQLNCMIRKYVYNIKIIFLIGNTLYVCLTNSC